MGEYDALREYLDASDEMLIRLTFAEVESILGRGLPPSARKRRPWWANESPGGRHTQARSWLNAGYRTQHVDLNAQTVEFIAESTSR